jgi:endonuclease/exonuclease/phosphatase family metal-dependent hydrolase
MKKILLIIFLAFALKSYPQENVKIMCYNLLSYPGTDAAIRNPFFKTVIRNAAPDILITEEMTSQAGVNQFLSVVMNAYGNTYSVGTFIDGPDTDNEIFFKTSRFHFISNTPIQTDLRNISEFKIIDLNYPTDTLRIYAVHLKASTGSTNEIARGLEVDSLRRVTNLLTVNASYMVVGDFNIYGSAEVAYTKLLQVNANNQGHFIDPIPNMTGIWNNGAYSHFHTQSPRTRAFGGGSTGGMDDRFDLILMSLSIMNNGRIAYIPATLTPYGNDGNHYNDSINRRPNTAVPDSVADAIHYASDHIPVFATYIFGNPIGISGISYQTPNEFSLGQNFPNPFNPSTTIKFDIKNSETVKLVIYDVLGNTIETLVNEKLIAGSYEVKWNASRYSSGLYFYKLIADNYISTKKMILAK